MNSIVYEGVSLEYVPGRPVLRNVNSRFDEGTITFITGRSGAGKTTMLRLLLGLIKPTRGSITVNGVDISTFDRRAAAQYRRKIGSVFQSQSLIDSLSVFQNIAMPLRIEGFDNATIRSRVHASLQAVGLIDQINLKPTWLSAGQKQRVVLARAVVNRPHLLIADEPTGNLDAELALEIIELFRWFNETGTTVLVATHDLDLPYSGDRALVIENGEVTEGVICDE